MIDAKELLNQVISNLSQISIADIPAIDLYMDQVTTFMDKHLNSHKRYDEDKILTKTMINNYAKNDLLPSPEKKRYSRDHMILLIFIYYFKNILTINDIKTILEPVSDRYFHSTSDVNLEQIYTAIVNKETSHIADAKSDIESLISEMQSSFPDFPEEDREFLQIFSLIVSLIYDVYIKKQMIESLVDSIHAKQAAHEAQVKAKKTDKDKKKS